MTVWLLRERRDGFRRDALERRVSWSAIHTDLA